MGVAIGSAQSGVRRYEIKDFNGSVVGVITIRKSDNSKSGKAKKKKLQYNFKEVSARILKAKTSGSARQVVTMARNRLAQLCRQAKSGKYNDKELENAIIHARKMVRIARKRMKHLQEEESVKVSEKAAVGEREPEDLETGDLMKSENQEEQDIPEEPEDFDLTSEEMLRQLMELQRQMEELEEEALDDTFLEELNDEMLSISHAEMTEADLERLKKKHRAKEMQEIVDADMKYLKAMFDELEKQQREAASGVSLELGGMEVPVETASVPVPDVGAVVDTVV